MNKLREKTNENFYCPRISNKPLILGTSSIVLFVIAVLPNDLISVQSSNFCSLFSFLSLMFGFSALSKFKKQHKDFCNTSKYKNAKLVLIIATILIAAIGVFMLGKIIYFCIYGFVRY